MAITEETTPAQVRPLAALDREWTRLRTSPAAAAALATWQQHEPDLAGFADLGELMTGLAPTGDPDRRRWRDRVALAVLRQARSRSPAGDVAARAMLALLAPGLRRIARRGPRSLVADRESETVAAALGRIRGWPCDRWTDCVVVHLLQRVRRDLVDASYEGRRPHRADAACWQPRLVPVDGAVLDDPTSPEVAGAGLIDSDRRAVLAAGGGRSETQAEELVRLLTAAVGDGQLRREQARLIGQTRLAGTPVATLAARTGDRPNTVTRRLRRAEVSLAAYARSCDSPSPRAA